MNYTELMQTLTAIETCFREHNVHEQFVKAIDVAKGLAHRSINPMALVRLDISPNQTNFNCPTCGFTYFKSEHPAGYNPEAIQLTQNDRHCIKCGQRIMMSHNLCLEESNKDILTSDYTM